MTRIIMHGCNGHMGQVITGIVANDANAQIVAGIDLRDDGHNLYPVFASLEECNVEADAGYPRLDRKTPWSFTVT